METTSLANPRFSRSAAGQVHRALDAGAAGGLSDRELLERFTDRGGEAAEAAFAALVERHGPMVLRACRSTLRDPHDAQDAFQATFLLLARRAGSLWVRDSLGPWLHSVACRVSAGARTAEARRRAFEQRAARRPALRPGEEARDDLGPALHEEVERLPERLRAPVVLCYLEGLTHEQAARHVVENNFYDIKDVLLILAPPSKVAPTRP
jgi:RNA polymerase sigma factor (sigma-70 family)